MGVGVVRAETWRETTIEDEIRFATISYHG